MFSRLCVNVTLRVLFHLRVIGGHDPSAFLKFPGLTLQVKNMLTHDTDVLKTSESIACNS